MKIAEIKEKYKSKVSKKCYYCNNEFEVTMNFGTTLDQIQLTTMNDSFTLGSVGGRNSSNNRSNTQGNNKSMVYDTKGGDYYENEDDDDNGGNNSSNQNVLDELLVEGSNPQVESDKQRQLLRGNSKEYPVRGGSKAKLSADSITLAKSTGSK